MMFPFVHGIYGPNDSILFLDTFTGANGTSIAARSPDIDVVGDGWVIEAFSITIESNRAEAQGPASGNNARAYFTHGGDDGNLEVSATLRTPGAFSGLIVRYVDVSNYLYVVILPALDRVNLNSRIAGSVATIGFISMPIATNTDYDIVVQLADTAVTITVDGANELVVNTTLFAGSTKAGLELDDRVSGPGIADNVMVRGNPSVAVSPFNIISEQILWTGSGSLDWVGRPNMLDDGSKWIATYRQATQHTPSEGTVIHIRFSEDEGETWTAEDTFTDASPVTGFPISGANYPIEAILCIAPNGDILCMTTEGNGSVRHGTFVYRSTDGGATWSAEGKINSDNELILAGGQMLTIGSTVYVAGWADPGADGPAPYKSVLYKSTDDGATWSHVVDITTTANGTNEIGMIDLDNDTLLFIIRSDSELVTYKRTYTISTDTLGTLTDVAVDLDSILQRPKLRRFGSSIYLFGRDLLNSVTNLQSVAVWRSSDDGETWTVKFYPTGDTYNEGSYCDILQRANGDFYMLNYEGNSSDDGWITELIFSE